MDTTGFTLICALMLLIGSCSSEIDTSKHISVVQEVLTVQYAFNQSYKTIASQISMEEELFEGYSNSFYNQGCVSLSLSPDSSQFFPALFNIDFGDACTIEEDVFEGAVSVVIDGFFNNPESSATISFQDYGFNESKLAADYTIRNKGKNEEDFAVVEHQITNGVFENKREGSSNYSASIFSTHITGHESSIENNGLLALEDDIWENNFSGTFISASGEIYHIQSETSLTDRWNCDFPTAGRMIIEGEDLQTNIIVDFGNGTCDRLITVEVAGEFSTLTFD